MPVLDVHGKPRRNTTTGKVEEFYVEAYLPLVKWSAGVEIQQNRAQFGTQQTHPLPPLFSTPSRYSPSRFFFMPTIFMSLILSLTRLVPRPKSQAPLSKAQYFDLNTLRSSYKIMCQSRQGRARIQRHPMARLSYLRYLSGLGNSTGLGNSLGNQRPGQGGGAGADANNPAGSSKKSSFQSRSKTSNFADKSFIRKRKRGTENVETSQTPGGTSTLSLNTDSISDTFSVGLMNIKKLDEIKWMNLLEYIKDNKLEALVLTEHMLQDTHTPSWVEEAGFEMHITLGKIKKTPQGSTRIGGVALIIKKDLYHITSKKIVNTTHQATCWTIESDFWAEKIHITGAYLSPDSRSKRQTIYQHTTDFFEKLAQHNLSDLI